MANIALRATKQVVVRVYAGLLLCLVVWTGYTAVSYLYHAVFIPKPLPDEFHQWHQELRTAALRSGKHQGEAVRPKRAPIGHYHRVEHRAEPDPGHGCTASGCHELLPHNRSKELRAFANMHMPFMTCEMCHDKTLQAPVAAVWVDSFTGRPHAVPAILRLNQLVEQNAEKIVKEPAEVHQQVMSVLAEAIEDMGGDPLLEYLRTRIDTAEPGSPVWRHAMEQLISELPNHAYGDYHARIAVRDGWSSPAYRAELAKATAEFFEASANSPARDKIVERIHAEVVSEPQGCLPCHGSTPAKLDFASLGYSQSRVDTLTNTPAARLIQDIQDGKPFQMPHVLGGLNGR